MMNTTTFKDESILPSTSSGTPSVDKDMVKKTTLASNPVAENVTSRRRFLIVVIALIIAVTGLSLGISISNKRNADEWTSPIVLGSDYDETAVDKSIVLWPELVGMQKDEALARIQIDRPDLRICTRFSGLRMSTNIIEEEDYVRVFLYRNGTVSDIPSPPFVV